MANEWDSLSTKFNVHKDESEIDPGAADNILLAWPPILNAIHQHFPDPTHNRALDYGCGTGGFTMKLHELGFDVTGMDYSEGMIAKAKEATDGAISFIVSDASQPLDDSSYNLISGIMVFQFVEDIDVVMTNLDAALEPGGMMVFAVFNPKYVTNCLEAGVSFADFDSTPNPKVGTKLFRNGPSVPVYIRTAKEYEEILASKGYKKVLEEYPPFTPEFLEKYGFHTPTDESEFLVMAFVKNQPHSN